VAALYYTNEGRGRRWSTRNEEGEEERGNGGEGGGE